MTVLLLCLTKKNYRTQTDVQNVDVRIVVRIPMFTHHVSTITHVNLAVDGTFRGLFGLLPADHVSIIFRAQI